MLEGTVLLLVLLVSGTGAGRRGSPSLLVGNTRGGNIVGLFREKGLQEVVGGLEEPDHIRIVDDYLYASVADRDGTPESSNMYRENLVTGEVDDAFLKGSFLQRPYGFDFYKGRIYVSSFLTDQIVIYDMKTGAYIGIFTQGNGTEEGLCNGPNHISIFEDKLYVTTRGSFKGDFGDGLKSQVIVYDLKTGEGEVFAQPEPEPDGLPFVSMLGIEIACLQACSEMMPPLPPSDCCKAYTTDFAGGLRVYNLDGTLKYNVSTTFFAPGEATTGALSVDDDLVYVAASENEDGPGVVLRYNALDGSLLPAMGSDAFFISPDDDLKRPIGILALPEKGRKKGKKGGKGGKKGKDGKKDKEDKGGKGKKGERRLP